MKNKFVGLIILDGYGVNKSAYGNAIKQGNPKHINALLKNYPHTYLQASGKYVGLPDGQIGNSEVGHLNIGAGKIVLQTLQKINASIKDKSFYQNENLLKAVLHAKNNNSALHLMGLTSTGGVHSHLNHLFALIDLCKQHGLQKVYVHVFTDGRDTMRNSGIEFVRQVQQKLAGTTYEIATVMGRFYAMDREQNYERTKRAYDALVHGVSNQTDVDPINVFTKSYEKGVYDEFIEPVVITKNDISVATIGDNDAIIFYNYREDRARQLTSALMERPFHYFPVKDLKNVIFTGFVRYDHAFQNPLVAFEMEYLTENLSQVVSGKGFKQFKIAETTKYAHVTYFLNGGIEKPYTGEDRYLIETIKTEKFDTVPQMRAREITQKAIERIQTKQYALMVLNYSNCDMLGHTGNLPAAIETVKIIDEEVDKLVNAILAIDGIAILVADHGNAEQMLDAQGNVLTDHTTNKVPFVIVGKQVKNLKLHRGGVLGNITPTILELLGIDAPASFTCKSLIVK